VLTRRATALRAGLLVATSAAVVAVFAAPAAAHVTITPTAAKPGGFVSLTFNVPNEEDNSSTVKVEINFPAEAPVASVSVQPVPGWTETMATTKLAKPITNDDGDQVTEAVSKVTFTAAEGKGLHAGEFQQFTLSVGPLPTVNQMVFKVLQYYANGDIVRWIDPTNPGRPEPGHPAPVLTLSAATGEAPPTGGPTATGSAPAAPPAASSNSSGGNGGALLGLLGLVAGMAALVVAILAYRRAGPRPAA
jgi:uncharacterized protein YcnI